MKLMIIFLFLKNNLNRDLFPMKPKCIYTNMNVEQAYSGIICMKHGTKYCSPAMQIVKLLRNISAVMPALKTRQFFPLQPLSPYMVSVSTK